MSDSQRNATLLIVDDEKPTRDGLRAALEDRFDVYVAEDAGEAMGLLESEHFDVMLTDFRLPQEDGMRLITRAKSLPRPPVCILMTAYGSEELAVQAMKQGADDYIAKGRLQIDELEMRIARALKQQSLEEENLSLRDVNRRELAIMLAFILFIFWIGIAPSGYFALIDTSVASLVSDLSASVVAMPVP